MIQIFESFCDNFRNSGLNGESRHTSSPSNNVYANLIQQRFKQTIISAKVSVLIYLLNYLNSNESLVFKGF